MPRSSALATSPVSNTLPVSQFGMRRKRRSSAAPTPAAATAAYAGTVSILSSIVIPGALLCVRGDASSQRLEPGLDRTAEEVHANQDDNCDRCDQQPVLNYVLTLFI